jgi:nitrate reductase NapA
MSTQETQSASGNGAPNNGATRRDVLKIAAATAATAALTGYGVAEAAPGGEAALGSGVTWGKAPCRFCGTGCGTRVATEKGKVIAVTGDPKCGVNKGLLCAKGYHLPAALTASDRLTHPLLRDGDSYKQISWDEALDIAASKFKESVEKNGPESVAFYGSGQWTIQEGYAANKWFKGGIQSNNVEANARLCMASAVVGLITTFGADEPMGCYDDIDHADVFVLWGNNMSEMHPVLFSRMLDRRNKAKHVKIVDMTTRKTPTSSFADKTMLFTPMGDLAIANGIARWLIANGKVDEEFVNAHCVFKAGKTDIGYGTEDHFTFKPEPKGLTFDEYKQLVDPYTPEYVEALSGVKQKDLIALAEAFGDPAKRVTSFWCMGMNQHVRGTWINNLVYAVHLLSGKIGVPGSTPFSLTGQPSACGTVREVGTLAHGLPGGRVVKKPEHRAFAEKVWGLPEGTIKPKPGYHTVEMFRALDRGDIKVMWVQVTNPFQSMPNLGRFRDGKRSKIDDTFVIVSDIYPTETTRLADLILPSAGWVEKEGCFGNSERRTQQWDKLSDPPGEAKPDVWQTVEVARRMGYEKLFPKTENAEKSLEKLLYDEYREFTLGSGKDIAEYELLRKVPGLRWPVVDGRETPWRFDPQYDPYAKKEPGRRMDFYGQKANGHRAVIWFRPWEPAAEPPDDAYPFWLCTGRVLEHWHTGTMTRRVKELHQAVPHAYCEIHPDDAARIGIAPGGDVKLTSRRGSIVLPAVIKGRGEVQKGHVFVPFFEEEKAINDLTLDAFCPMSKEPDYKKCAVQVKRA